MTPADRNRAATLLRLAGGERLIRQEKHFAGSASEGAWWWEGSPHLGGPRPWKSTLRWLQRHGFVLQAVPFAYSSYRDPKNWSSWAITPAGQAAARKLGRIAA